MSTSFTSDQTTLQKDTGAISLLRGARTRVTSIQGEGIAGSQLLLHDTAVTGDAAAGNLMATYNYGTEGLSVYVPGSGILFKDGVCATLTGTGGSITLTITGA
jgi:hypothetical protein